MVKRFNSAANLSTNLFFPTLPPSFFTMNRFLSDWLVTWGLLQAGLSDNLSDIWKFVSENKPEKSHNLKAQYFTQYVLTG